MNIPAAVKKTCNKIKVKSELQWPFLFCLTCARTLMCHLHLLWDPISTLENSAFIIDKKKQIVCFDIRKQISAQIFSFDSVRENALHKLVCSQALDKPLLWGITCDVHVCVCVTCNIHTCVCVCVCVRVCLAQHDDKLIRVFIKTMGMISGHLIVQSSP